MERPMAIIDVDTINIQNSKEDNGVTAKITLSDVDEMEGARMTVEFEEVIQLIGHLATVAQALHNNEQKQMMKVVLETNLGCTCGAFEAAMNKCDGE